MNRQKQTTLYSFQDWNGYQVLSLTQSWPTLSPPIHSIDVSNFKDIGVTIIGTGWVANVKIKWTFSEANMHWLPQNRDGNASPTSNGIPNFSIAPSLTNQWSYIESIDYDSGLPYAWSTWIDITSLDTVKMFEVNSNLLSRISFQVTGNVYIQVSWYSS